MRKSRKTAAWMKRYNEQVLSKELTPQTTKIETALRNLLLAMLDANIPEATTPYLQEACCNARKALARDQQAAERI